MQYALINVGTKRLNSLDDLDQQSEWQYPAGFTIVPAPGFRPDPTREYADYVYKDGGFVLDPQSDLPLTLDELVEQKVADALAAQS